VGRVAEEPDVAARADHVIPPAAGFPLDVHGQVLLGWLARAGFAGAYLLRRDLGHDGTAELTAHTFWESPEAIRAFAGNDITVAIVEPETQAMLLDFDRTAAHRSVVIDAVSAQERQAHVP
jgi:hypothetical protein